MNHIPRAYSQFGTVQIAHRSVGSAPPPAHSLREARETQIRARSLGSAAFQINERLPQVWQEIFLMQSWETGPYHGNPLAMPSIRQARHYSKDAVIERERAGEREREVVALGWIQDQRYSEYGDPVIHLYASLAISATSIPEPTNRPLFCWTEGCALDKCGSGRDNSSLVETRGGKKERDFCLEGDRLL
ncbi:unnamed protein product [Pleuronectes platessa]|uniref:Uncharacterized protein n=1 Tax=Pleuronectes platessa TaxID=8262 RepID=A0A9N7VDT9_PLEPL|nr:unnamed protein product [Pleuronectes platessa]